jgi:hypothetical protein
MAKVFYLHWNKDEALETVRALRADGHTVSYHHDTMTQAKITTPLDVCVISLDRLPSHGRAVAEWVAGTKRTRKVPIVFVGGTEEKIEATRQKFSTAMFCEPPALKETIRKLVSKKSAPRRASRRV